MNHKGVRGSNKTVKRIKALCGQKKLGALQISMNFFFFHLYIWGNNGKRRKSMRVMVFVKATKESEEGLKSSPEMKKMFEDMDRFNKELMDAGILKEGNCDGLKPSSAGKRIAFDGPNRTVKDGPFGSPGELVAGFWIWDVKDMDEAVEWVKKCPNPMLGPSEIEIRPIFEMEDLPDTLNLKTNKLY
jgi:hypothetical protein